VNFWWVNQGQTFRQERRGGYLWSPKRKKGPKGPGTARNPFYEYMREVGPGDMVFSYEGGYLRACGVITSYCYESPRPNEFGKIGERWDTIGWRVDVRYSDPKPFRPLDWMDRIARFLTAKHSPLTTEGRGKELYLTTISPQFADILIQGMGKEAEDCRKAAVALHAHETTSAFEHAVHEEVDKRIEGEIMEDPLLPETVRKTIVESRIGQGEFRQLVAQKETACRITGVENLDHLVASHIKPWRFSNNRERLDPSNGLMLTPTPDHLFDKGFISFSDTGTLLYAPRVSRVALQKMKMPEEGMNVGAFSSRQVAYLTYHREYIFKKSLVA